MMFRGPPLGCHRAGSVVSLRTFIEVTDHGSFQL
jgi:hypothetical protein